jgi:hypothetical protein
MNSLQTKIRTVHFARDVMRVDLLDGRSLSVPLAWYPSLLHATGAARRNWKTCGAGTGLHWPSLDYHLSAEGLLAGLPEAPGISAQKALLQPA